MTNYIVEMLLGGIVILQGVQIYLRVKKPTGLHYVQPKPQVVTVEVPTPILPPPSGWKGSDQQGSGGGAPLDGAGAAP